MLDLLGHSKGTDSVFLMLLSSLVGILFGPLAFLSLKYLSVVSILSGVTGDKKRVSLFGLFRVEWKETSVGIIFESILEAMVLKKVLNSSAMTSLLFSSFPFI